ncbi:hypothetical protein HF265_00405 [Rhizobium leguminosarum]|uniref:hypothetical protein n=1 Tax=Rhizobium leguminosarum TaxID=384 RepID=UPI001C919D73|nr:hypothetical protein [Rhizobium leguminosarum]MBY3027582.1 hypothetical protein [Rhizobium leguminosarum]
MKSSYAGPLKEPLAPIRRPALSEDAAAVLRAELERLRSERAVKIGLLLDHYEIARSDPQWERNLLWALIDEHVPGLADPHRGDDGAPVGATLDWTVSRNLQLIADVARAKLDTDRSIKALCEELCQSGAYAGMKAASLQNRFNEARKMPFAELLEQAGLSLDRPDLWQQFAEAYSDTPEVENLNNSSKRKQQNNIR